MNLFDPTEEHAALRQTLRSFVQNEVEPQALEFNNKEMLNLPLLKRLGSELGLMGIGVEEEYGGADMDAVAFCIAHEELSASDPAFCLAYLAHTLLFVNNLAVNGTPAHKAKYLADVVSGEKIGGMCMSEPGAGTDVLGMKTKAVKQGDKYVLNGSKMWITNGALNDSELGDIFWVYARTGEKRSDLSTFIVEKGTPGFKLGQRIKDKLGMRASTTAELVFENCEIPAENLVGQENDATKHMMRNLEIERVALAAMSLGIARRSIDIMRQYCQERVAFGKPINSFGQVQRHISESYAEYMAARAYVYMTAANLDLRAESSSRMDSDGVKLLATTMGKNVSDRAIQCLGGYGYVGEYVVERLWRDAKLLEIGGGTIEAHQKNITKDLASCDSWYS